MLLQLIPPDWIKRKTLSLPRSIELVNGSEIILFGGKSYDTLRGFGINRAVVDEVKDQKPELIFEVLMPALSDNEGFLEVIGTPEYNDIILELWENPHFSKHQYTTLQGGRVPAEEIERQKQILDERTFRQEYEASIETFTGRTYYAYGGDNWTDIKFDNLNRIWLSFDFNINPMTCTLIQQKGEEYYIAVKEFVLRQSNTIEMCRNVDRWLTNQKFGGLLEVTGDATGRRLQSSGAGKSDWKIIEDFFKNYEGYYRNVKRSNPRVKDRVNGLNALFKNYNGEIRLFVNPKECPNLNKDLMRQVWKDDGTLDPGSDNTLGHSADNLGYWGWAKHPIKHVSKANNIY